MLDANFLKLDLAIGCYKLYTALGKTKLDIRITFKKRD